MFADLPSFRQVQIKVDFFGLAHNTSQAGQFVMKELNTIKILERLEEYWRDFVLVFPWATDMKEAVVASYPKLPYYEPNHAASINVDENAAKNLLRNIVKHFVSQGSPAVWFRISPLTCPSSFSSFLEENGFRKDFETSVMTFKGGRLKDSIIPNVRIKEISKREIEVWKALVCTIFAVPPEWREGFDTYVRAYVSRGARCYLAYIDDRPVGTCSLLSLDRSGGIFTVGTLEEYRRRGIGSALTVHALSSSVKEGNTLHLLYVEKGEYAEHLYRRIGFETHHTATWFVKEL